MIQVTMTMVSSIIAAKLCPIKHELDRKLNISGCGPHPAVVFTSMPIAIALGVSVKVALVATATFYLSFTLFHKQSIKDIIPSFAITSIGGVLTYATLASCGPFYAGAIGVAVSILLKNTIQFFTRLSGSSSEPLQAPKLGKRILGRRRRNPECVALLAQPQQLQERELREQREQRKQTLQEQLQQPQVPLDDLEKDVFMKELSCRECEASTNTILNQLGFIELKQVDEIQVPQSQEQKESSRKARLQWDDQQISGSL
jgi:hypothetical protein